jgi:hypothetical protein
MRAVAALRDTGDMDVRRERLTLLAAAVALVGLRGARAAAQASAGPA